MSRAVRVQITGLVQGVGFRAWTDGTAQALGLAGWVRNRRDGSVEAVFFGDDATVAKMLAACRQGPAAGRVDAVAESDAAVPEAGFRVLPTV